MLKSRITFALILATVLLFALYYDVEGMGFVVLYAVLLLFLLCAVSALLAPLCIRVQEQAGEDAVLKNESLPYRLRIANRGPFFYPGLRILFRSGELVDYRREIGLSISPRGGLRPFGKLGGEGELSFPYRGAYPIGVERIQVTDFLGIFRRTILPQGRLEAVVFPEGDENFALTMRSEPQNASLNTDPFQEDYSTVADVRKYNSSDSLRKIHWQLSAKRGELIAKNFHSFEPNHTLLFLDTRAIPLPPMEAAAFADRMVSYTVSAIGYCRQGKVPATLVYGDRGVQQLEVDPEAPPDKVYFELARVPFGETRSALALYSRELATFGAFNMVLFLSTLDSETHDALRELVSFDHGIVLYRFWNEALPIGEEEALLLESAATFGVGVNRVECEPEAL